MKIDFFARRSHFVDHLAPIWHALRGSERGIFYVSHDVSNDNLVEYCQDAGVDAVELDRREAPPGYFPILCAAYDDMVQAMSGDAPDREFVLMEHGVGLVFGTPGYAGGHGLRDRVNLFLAPNDNIAEKLKRAQPNTRRVVIGTPKLDRWFWQPSLPSLSTSSRPTVVISFHWDGSAVAPEAGNAYSEFEPALRRLAESKEIVLAGHAHPKIAPVMAERFAELEIPFIQKFEDVMDLADVYVNDASSTMYEFLVTGKPVVLMNSPTFRRDVDFGIRFWQYTDIGIHANQSSELIPAIEKTLASPREFEDRRNHAVAALYPFFGYSAGRAAGTLQAIYGN